jgi:glycosyltransferase involved in cell wall biosynthesis
MGAGKPLVTVVMPSLNQANYVEAAVRSVLEQDYVSTELLIGDGGSSDATLQKLEELQGRFGSRLRWVSEKDSGPASAVNKLLHRARGDILGWVNSDDMYAPSAVGRAVARFVADPKLQMIYGEGEHVDQFGAPAGRYPTLPPASGIDAFSDGCFICQPTVFLRRNFFDEVGFLDESLVTAFDFDLWLRAFRKLAQRISFVEEVQAFSRIHQNTLTHRLRRTVALEGITLLSKHLGIAPTHWFWTYVDELCATYPFAHAVPDLVAEVNGFLEASKAHFSRDSLESLKRSLAADVRMQAFPSGVGAQIFPDGWAPELLTVRIARAGRDFSRVRIRCTHESPQSRSLVLQTRTSWGDSFVERIDRHGPFVLDVPIPRTAGENLSIVIRSSETFVPQPPAQGLPDTRRLAFRVVRLSLED